MKHPVSRWLRDAWVTGADLLVTAALITAAVLVHSRWLAAVAGLWSALTLRQGYLAVRARRSGRG
ncbi:hypothetical protein QMK19_04460 [Streptomyces sp. H10-C2]|uniref:hypothetical protein n=1 Tax=unclassified Streptomyces TaxID=2593676 RepID=UPI0024B954AC|nr:MULTISPECIES: hypothetical protein [unclassified Streptomyces]MDJ0341738.1 hypothetical protein [Streptomyces sp. PH10-H1]MDJ0368954.1 hypothetical protein [Streptomyces sp. H10-C2]